MEYKTSNEINKAKEISDRIDFIRRQNNLTQEQLAVELNISQPAVSKYLKERIPPSDVLLKLARLGQTTIEWILSGEKRYFYEDQASRVKDNEDTYSVDTDIILARKIALLPTEAKKTISDMIDLLLSYCR
ncbi:MAG: XRE family transcriptional regulator [Calditrichaeota bacterium]|nr:MAG: XRE family transcriptional regulator [Calditrichota bacterium]MBL1206294.1 XRE family transcriptional regulator [Calditrichota bacterium]NOG46120.1 helix-turn-helix transcriptional regulator [Calditrichota bacterium]